MEGSSDEQEMEVEALQSIYGEQFTVMAAKGDEPVYEMKLQPSKTKIVFTIPEKYPADPPSISCVTEDNQPVYVELESLLYNSAQKCSGEVMIYNLIEEAKDWIKKLELTEQMRASSHEEVKPPEDIATICKFFLEGKCKFGDRCFNKHEETTSSKSSTKDGSLHSKLSAEGTEELPTKVNGISNGASKSPKHSGNRRSESKEDEGSKKKPPMKTASDVISRIQWDEELSPKDFVVGYLDRFIGIVEKCFTDLSWEDLASVDHFVDLAIPRHRIQYFKYLGEIVWDKRERMDKVFGSTGSKETILDVKERIGVQPDSNEVSNTETDDVSCVASELPKPVKEKNGPNYFIAVPITDVGIIDRITKIQNTLQAKLGHEVEYELIPNHRLHITLLMLTLHTEDHIATAKSILKSVQPLLVSLLPPSRHKLRFNGLDQFHNRVLYSKVEPDMGLSKLVQALKYKFEKAGISLEGNRDVFVPHVTIMRSTSRDLLSAGHVQEKLSDLMKDNHEFGDQCVESLTLFSRFLPKDIDGTHHKISTVENSLKSLSSTLPRKLCQYVDHLLESEQVCESERNDIQALFQSGDAVKLDTGLARLTQLSNAAKDVRMVLIMRGLPGSGKTHLVENSLEADAQSDFTYCSARQLFHKSGASAPDPSELNIAEAYCRSCFLDAMANLCPFIVVDGVHTKCWEYAVYKCLAQAFGYSFQVLEIRVTQPEDIKLCQQNCNSGVALEQLLEDVQEWEDDPEATVIEPWFNKPDAFKYTESVSLKKLLSS